MSKNNLAIIEQAKELVPGFREGFSRFKERVTIDQMSPSLLENYGQYLAHVALHFGKSPEKITVEKMNLYLYRLSIEENYSKTFFKFTVFGMRYWYRLYELEEEAIKMPSIRHKERLPEVLSKDEIKKLIRSARNFKHQFMLAFFYSTGMRLNEVRMLKITKIFVPFVFNDYKTRSLFVKS
jgi:integrase/recombinase XerD